MNPTLATVDWVVVGTYLGFVVLVGLYFARRQTTTSDFFLGGRSLPWWAAALSIIAAETSAVTYIGTPGMAYAGDWWFLQFVVGLVVGRVFLALVFVKLIHGQGVLTVYGLLERRFGNTTRGVTALLFLLGRLIASGVRMYAGCLAVQVATGLPLNLSVLVLGAFATLYTLAGGIRAVVWTDVLLGLTFIAGGLISAVYLAGAIPGGLEAVVSSPAFAEKTAVLHIGWALDDAKSLLAGLAGGCVLTLATHGTDQDIVQRILTCRTSRSGSLSLLGTAVLLLPLMALFLAVGTGLFFLYSSGHPTYEVPRNVNHVFPVFIVRELPRGFSGLVMAGLFAASISSFSSVINALASTTLSDFYKPLLQTFGRTPSEGHQMRLSRGLALFWAAALLVVALGFQGSSDNVLSVALSVLTYFYGAILGAFLLGAFTRRGRALTVIPGMLLGVAVVLLLQLRQFIELPARAPDSMRALLARLPEGLLEAVEDLVPLVAWPYWIILGTGITFLVGAIGSRGLTVSWKAVSPKTPSSTRATGR